MFGENGRTGRVRLESERVKTGPVVVASGPLELPTLFPVPTLQKAIAQQTGVSRVKAVMVFWNRFDAGLVEGKNIVFVHCDRLVGWLEEQRGEMSSDWVAHVAACIKEGQMLSEKKTI